ncbi:MAG: helix-turn-helix transcriptional regulator [Oscillospiraceae bacterium]|nr:helix-turn-helix transcriptional regulator [Oscillospiraceae bacterium]
MEYGTIKIKLDELMAEKDMSKRRLCRMAELNWEQANNCYKGSITRFDADVLARICKALDCNISDLLEYVPPEEIKDEKQ